MGSLDIPVLPVEDEVWGLADEHDLIAEWHRDPRRLLVGMLAHIRRLNAEMAEDEAFLQTIVEELHRKNSPKKMRAQWLEEQVKALAESLLPEGSKHVDVPGIGRIQYSDKRTAVKVEDADRLLKWAKEHERRDLYESREHLLTNDAKKVALEALLTDGELLPGVMEVPAHKAARIEWEAKP
jgi:hypothetical protein